MSKNNWLKIGALAAGLVGASLAAGLVIKKKLSKPNEQVMFEDYDDSDWYDENELADQEVPDIAPVQPAEETVAQAVADIDELADEITQEMAPDTEEEPVE